MWSCSKLEVTWGAAALLLMALVAGAGEVLPLVALSALCHELGHLTVLKLVGAKVEQIRLTAFGAEIRADTRQGDLLHLGRAGGKFVFGGGAGQGNGRLSDGGSQPFPGGVQSAAAAILGWGKGTLFNGVLGF